MKGGGVARREEDGGGLSRSGGGVTLWGEVFHALWGGVGGEAGGVARSEGAEEEDLSDLEIRTCSPPLHLALVIFFCTPCRSWIPAVRADWCVSASNCFCSKKERERDRERVRVRE